MPNLAQWFPHLQELRGRAVKHRIFPDSELMSNSPKENCALGLRSHPMTCSQSLWVTSVPTFDMLSAGRKGLNWSSGLRMPSSMLLGSMCHPDGCDLLFTAGCCSSQKATVPLKNEWNIRVCRCELWHQSPHVIKTDYLLRRIVSI